MIKFKKNILFILFLSVILLFILNSFCFAIGEPKIIATYLKLDFQTEILSSLSQNNIKKTAFIC